MGSYDFTCAVSALPIGPGTPVVALMIQSGQFTGGDSDGGDWMLRSLPVYGEYNDYGSIENYTEGVLTRTWVDGLQHDLIEKGIGDNQIHDVGARKSMSFDDLLQALFYQDQVQVTYVDKEFEERVARRHGAAGLEAFMKKKEEADCVPTIERVEALLSAHAKFVTVDEPRGREIRVRINRYGEEKVQDESARIAILDECLALLTPHFSAMHAVGSGSYAGWDSEVVVRAKPGSKTGSDAPASVYTSPKHYGHEKGNLTMVMVRQDVWDYLLSEKKFDQKGYYAEESAKSLKQLFDYIFWKPDPRTPEDSLFRESWYAEMEVRHWTRAFPAIKAIHKANQLHPPTPEEEEIIRTEFAKLKRIFSIVRTHLRVSWHPRELVGEQEGNLKVAAHYHRNIAKIAAAHAKKRGW